MKKRIFPLLLTLCLLCSLAACGGSTLEEELKYFYGDNLYYEEGAYYAVHPVYHPDSGSPVTPDSGGRPIHMSPLGETDKEIHYQMDDVEMSVTVETREDGPAAFVTITNLHESLRLQVNSQYILEKQLGGQWYPVNLNGDCGYYGKTLGACSSLDFEIKLYIPPQLAHISLLPDRVSYITLSPGHYRLIQEQLLFEEPGSPPPYDESEYFNLAVEFDVK